MHDELFLVTGASGKLALAFIKKLKKENKTVFALSRNVLNIEGAESLVVDLLDKNNLSEELKKVDFTNFSKIFLIHPVGKFKFERSFHGIDDEVYNTNFVTIKNIIDTISSLSEKQKLKVCAFASVSDKYDVPFWQSYTKSKNLIRSYLKSLCDASMSGALMANVSTVDTGNENLLRPNADKTYWLDPDEIVEKVLNELSGLSGYKEIDIFKVKPGFDQSYYLDHKAILSKWENEMD
jgi:short-subunit dehydrogenase